jgi:hypothetical protein
MEPSLRRCFGEPLTAHVCFHLAKTRRHRIQYGAIDAFGHDGVKLGSPALDLAQDRRRGWRQSQTPDSPVLGIGAALDEAKFFETIDEARDGYGRHLGNGREFALRHVGLPLQSRQNNEWRGQTVLLVGTSAHMAGDVAE